MNCKIYLRRHQTIDKAHDYQSDKVTVFAPMWVRDALKELGKQLQNTVFEVYEECNGNITESQVVPSDTIQITSDFNGASLVALQKVARNEPYNTTGIINFELYPGIGTGVVYSLRDLVRHCVVVGVDRSSQCGGYQCPVQKQKSKRVYVIDLAALQFQQPYNTGRLVLLEKHSIHNGILDDIIFKSVVGETKKTFEQIHSILQPQQNDPDLDEYNVIKSRYIPHPPDDGSGEAICYLDAVAYSTFVKYDVILSGLAIAEQATKHYPGDKVVFKFLKYGTGFFAGPFSKQLNILILPAVLNGIEELLNIKRVTNIIRRFELPFYHLDATSTKRIKSWRKTHNIKIKLSSQDALQQTKKKYFIATTNCGDNHAMCGNEMGFQSVDAAIAENLESKGNIFSANINLQLTEQYIDFHDPAWMDPKKEEKGPWQTDTRSSKKSKDDSSVSKAITKTRYNSEL